MKGETGNTHVIIGRGENIKWPNVYSPDRQPSDFLRMKAANSCLEVSGHLNHSLKL